MTLPPEKPRDRLDRRWGWKGEGSGAGSWYAWRSNQRLRLAEFDICDSRRLGIEDTDTERCDDLLSCIGGKRFTYRRIGEAQNAIAEG